MNNNMAVANIMIETMRLSENAIASQMHDKSM